MLSTFEVDGVPAVTAKRSGPLTAGLVFRVGQADETLATAGVTHLVEHLALHRFGVGEHHFGGATGADHTFFETTGSEAEVVAFLAGVCASLNDLPLDRLETEKSILRTEESRRGAGQLARHRYGAQGYGLPDFPELGVPRLGPAEVGGWARTWFTRDNAALWVAGERVPAGLRLPLPAGVRRPVPPRPVVLGSGPAYFSHGVGGVAFSTVVRRGPAAQVFAKVLERELFRALRQEGGYSYEVTTSYRDRGDGLAEIVGLADALPDKDAAVLGGVVDVLAQFKVGRIDARDVESVRAQAESALYGADAVAARLPAHAVALLSGVSLPNPEDRIAELRALGVADVHAVAVEACGAMLLQAPHGRSADWAGYTAVPACSPAAVTGTRFAARDRADCHLVVGAEGCSLHTPEGASTVRFADCVAMLAWPDGGRRLIGADARAVQVDPTLFTGVTPVVTAAIDAAIGPHRTLPQPARATPAPAPRPSATAGKRASRPLFVVAAVFGVIALLATAGMAMEPPEAGGWVGAGFLWLLAGLFVFTGVRRRRM
ncbi:hypothetical protein M8542_40825 [Amycolatopsis sp. OK19-0408]|uniref:Uncharacterized protein n=1 Tax=Amycolatopsis iheyensis TaxID=2945988 RepID=A0A9X2SNM4_9PSEU|nr:hypothetical protein [Amycolatopsis iheyensis]MCR6489187.1 hypothetical protein [Amycolatopsis iheyensis]